MVLQKLQRIFLLSIPLSIVHGIEEYLTGFYQTDNFAKFFFSYAQNMSLAQASFVTFQIMFWLILIISAILIIRPKWQVYMMVIPGLIYIFELLHHLIKASMIFGYYPGSLTAIYFPFIAFFYWKQLIKDWKMQN